MNSTLVRKPEPISAKPNWNYDSYFLQQLERINNGQPNSASGSVATNTVPEEIAEPPAVEKNVSAHDGVQVEAQKIERNNVITRINELADSIGVFVTIIENGSEDE